MSTSSWDITHGWRNPGEDRAPPLSATVAWIQQVKSLVEFGHEVSPRGLLTKEILASSVDVDMSRPVVFCPSRKLNFKFMAAEAYWILSGDNRVETISKYNRNISQFSDDGVTFAGAYGPHVTRQLGYVAESIVKDSTTRQAVLTIWAPNPAPSKDIPCTISMQFVVRNRRLHSFVTMRSSDVWLGLPYDIFNFSMVAAAVRALIWEMLRVTFHDIDDSLVDLKLGTLVVNMGSSHIYERDLEGARACLREVNQLYEFPAFSAGLLPEDELKTFQGILNFLERLRDSAPGDKIRFWEAH